MYMQLTHGVTEHLGLMTQLVSLDLSYNSITNLPPSVAALQSLTYLNCSHNLTTQIPQVNHEHDNSMRTEAIADTDQDVKAPAVCYECLRAD